MCHHPVSSDHHFWHRPPSQAVVVRSAGLTRLELNTITGPTAIQYDEMLETLTNLEHLEVTKVCPLDLICIAASGMVKADRSVSV